MDIEEAKAEMERLGLTPEEFESGGRRERYDDDDDFDVEVAPEDFQSEYKPYKEENYDDDFDDDDLTDTDDED
jgi:hypothetical protein